MCGFKARSNSILSDFGLQHGLNMGSKIAQIRSKFDLAAQGTPPPEASKSLKNHFKFKLALGSAFGPGQEPKMKVVLAELARGRRSGGSPRPPGSILGGILTLKTVLFRCCFKLPRQSAFCMAFDCYFVRLSFGLKDCPAARANGAYADSTTKTDGFE